MTYYGQWACDKPHGMGTLSGGPNNFFYNGEFKQGRMHGKAIKKYEDKSTYDGQFVDDMREGLGKLV